MEGWYGGHACSSALEKGVLGQLELNKNALSPTLTPKTSNVSMLCFSIQCEEHIVFSHTVKNDSKQIDQQNNIPFSSCARKELGEVRVRAKGQSGEDKCYQEITAHGQKEKQKPNTVGCGAGGGSALEQT